MNKSVNPGQSSQLIPQPTQSGVDLGNIKQPVYRSPESATLAHAVKIAIDEDKPIMLDYWTCSLEKSVVIGVKTEGERLLVKSQDEYTSPISKICKVGQEYIIMTENSIYIVDVNIPIKRVSA